MMPIFHLRNRA